MKENSVEEDIEIVEKFNKENRFRDCGKINNAIEHILSDYKRVQEEFKEVDHECSRLEKKEFELEKENEKLQKENEKLREIRNTTAYGIETVNLIPKSRLVEINTNRYMIEIEAGKFVDLKQVYQENEELKSKNKRINEKIKELNNKINKVKEYCNETIDFKASFNERYDDCYDILKML